MQPFVPGEGEVDRKLSKLRGETYSDNMKIFSLSEKRFPSELHLSSKFNRLHSPFVGVFIAV
jgi:hypothetical protein